MVRSRLTCLVAIALASVFTGTAGASEQRAEPWTEPASPDTTLDQILTALRARTDTVLSVDAVTFDGVYMDSVVAGFDSTVVADGVSGAVQSKRDWERRGRFGFSLGLGNSRMRYTKVDGASLQLPIEASYSVGEFDARIGGRAGYAFASQRGRHNLGVTARYDRWRASLRHRRDIARFGSTQLHGAWLYTLAGADEQDYFERHGWVATVSRGLGPGLTAAVTYWNERQSPRSAENVFTIGSKSAASELNYPATEGRLRAIGIRLERYRREGHRFWGVIRFESAGGGLGGDMEYDQITAGLHGVSILPWDDELLLSLGTTVTSGDDAISEQALADIGGRSSLRGYPRLAFGGTHAIGLRAEYITARDLLAMTRLPFADRLHVQLIPFADLGATWTPADVTSLNLDDFPGGSDWKWGAGIGIRRGVGFGELLSHVRLDVAWRLDRGGASPVAYFVLEGEPF